MKASSKGTNWASMALLALGAGCGDDGGSAGTTGDPSPGGENPGSGAGNVAECAGAFATVPAPYTPNTSLDPWGGFLADEQGLVFSAFPDPNDSAYDSDLPPVLYASDLSGDTHAIFTAPGGDMLGPIFGDGADVYFVLGLINPTLMRMPRAGGEASILSSDRIWAGPVSDGTKLYYSTRPAFTDSVITALDPATGATEVLADRGEIEVAEIAFDQGTLFWVERVDVLSEEDYEIYRMPVTGGTPELIMTVPDETAIGSFGVVGNVAFGSTITESYGIEIARIEFGRAPEVVADDGGLPMLVTSSNIYYSSRAGLSKNSIAFDSPSVVEGSSGKAIAAIAAGPTDIWFSDGPCIYRAPF